MLCYPQDGQGDAERTTLATGSNDFYRGGVREDHCVPEEEGPADVHVTEEGDARVPRTASLKRPTPEGVVKLGSHIHRLRTRLSMAGCSGGSRPGSGMRLPS